MKKIAILLLFLSSLRSYADTVISESLESHGRNITMTLKIKGDKIRIDASPMVSIIMDITTGDSLSIIHPQKSYMKISGAQQKAIIDLMKKSSTPAEKPNIVDTGKSEKVGNFNAEIYTLNTPTSNLTLWITKDIPNDVVEKLRQFQKMKPTGAAGVFAPDTSDLPGIPVKTQIVKGAETITITILSVEEKAIDDADMAPPAGYKEISMPNLGGAGGPPANQ